MSLPVLWTPIWLTAGDVENGINKATLLACFDDGGGDFNAGALLAVISQAETEVLSWLPEFGPPPFTQAQLAGLASDYFLRSAALEFAKYFVFDRHPEYVRSQGKEQKERWDRAVKRMERVLDARQRPPTVNAPPANVGGTVTRGTHTIRLRPGERGDY